MKVYGGRFWLHTRYVHAVIAAKSQKEAAAKAGVALHEVRTYWSETANDHEIAAATAQPGVLLFSQKDYGDDRVFEAVVIAGREGGEDAR